MWFSPMNLKCFKKSHLTFSPGVEISLDTHETRNLSCLPVETFTWDIGYQTSQWRNECVSYQGFCLFFRENHVHTSLPLLTAYPWPGVTSSQQQKPVQLPSIHEYPLEPFLSQLWKNTRSLAKNTQLSWSVQTERAPGLAVNVRKGP